MSDDASSVVGQHDESEAGRSGEDARRRGWFWHWNTIITQYAPIVGLKGVGLLNSYTVWTDRREESPHRGYAFPSQQSEADFYGEDRAELITINKILVALDLIEIRKEMVLRVDARGRRWRVPHNLYRVKDHHDGYALTAEAVLRVVELATKDAPVYRYIRRIFSSRFAPIDKDNAWHQILPVVREHPNWQKLAQRTEKEEARASARTKAGHASRAKRDPDTSPGQRTSTQKDDSDSLTRRQRTSAVESADPTSVEETNKGLADAVEPSNSGLHTNDEPGNEGFEPKPPTFDEQTNEERGSAVDQSNTTYNQVLNTTTTTTIPLDQEKKRDTGSGPLLDATASVVAYFEAANGRPASPLERDILAELERAFDESARSVESTGSEWIVAAIREAVNSGSRFVAPKRIREILSRWSTEADPLRPSTPAPPTTQADMTPHDLRLPHGQGSGRTWERVLQLLSRVLAPAEMNRLFEGSRITGYQAGTITVVVSTADAAERLSGEYYDLTSRKLAEVMRRPIRIEFVVQEHPGTDTPDDPEPVVERTGPIRPPRFFLPGGLTNVQVWAAAQDELAHRLTPATWETWIRPAMLIGQESDGTLVIGAPNAFAQKRLSTRLLPEIAEVVGGIVGSVAQLKVVVTQEWLRSQTGPASGDDDDNDGGLGDIDQIGGRGA